MRIISFLFPPFEWSRKEASVLRCNERLIDLNNGSFLSNKHCKFVYNSCHPSFHHSLLFLTHNSRRLVWTSFISPEKGLIFPVAPDTWMKCAHKVWFRNLLFSPLTRPSIYGGHTTGNGNFNCLMTLIHKKIYIAFFGRKVSVNVFNFRKLLFWQFILELNVSAFFLPKLKRADATRKKIRNILSLICFSCLWWLQKRRKKKVLQNVLCGI